MQTIRHTSWINTIDWVVNVKIEFRWDKPKPLIAREKTGGSKGRLFLANKAKKFMDPYVPADNLVLAQNTEVYVEDNIGVVEYASPYAHYQWQGELYVSSVTGSPWAREGEYKVPASPPRDLQHSNFRHPLATSHWEEAMKVARGKDLAKAVENYLKG